MPRTRRARRDRDRDRMSATEGKMRFPIVDIRPVHVDDWRAYRAARLHSLEETPTSFGSTLAREVAFDDAQWMARMQSAPNRITFVAAAARNEDVLVGMATGLLGDERDDRVVELVGMWVHAELRGTGVAASLVNAVMRWARENDAIEATLWCSEVNPRGQRFYERCGFAWTGATYPSPSHPHLLDRRMTRAL